MHSAIPRTFTSTARRAACTAGTMTLTAALLLGTVPPAGATAVATSTTSGTTTTTTVAPADMITDAFARTVTGGWGTATLGGAWTTSGSTSIYAVSGGAGTHRLGNGVTSAAFLNDVETTDSDTRVDVAFDRAAGSGPAAYASVLGRSVRGASDYRARLVVTWGGAVELHVARGSTILARTAVPELTHTPGVRTTVRVQVTGTAPTTVRAKAWRTGTTEPAGWHLATTDADPAMQAPGRVGLSTYVSGNSTALTTSYADLHVAPTVAPNVAPTAAFGARAEDLGLAVDGSESSDPDGTVVGYAWQFGDGATATGRTATHTYAAPGTYRVTLTVTDSRGATATTARTVTAVAPNLAPVARSTTEVRDLDLTLDASASTDTDGTITAVHWDHGDGTTSTGTTSRHTYAAPGLYPVTLTVTDDRGGRSTVTRTVTAVAPNVLPTAAFAAATDDLGLAVDASSSTDSDGTITSHHWAFGDGAVATGRTATHTYAAPGQYTVTLTVTDDRGGSATTTRTVTAIAPNVLPTARFTPTAQDLTVALDASASSDPDGTVRSLRWDLGDGTVITGWTPRHTYAAPGVYPVTLTVTDDRGGQHSVQQSVTAVAPNVAPTARLRAIVDDLRVGLDATDSVDPDGRITAVRWDLGDGTTATGATAQHTYAAPGDYTVRVTVVDDRGGTDTVTRTVTALAPNVAPAAALSADAADLRVTLDGRASTDRDGAITSYRWDLGDGTTLAGPTAGHTYAAAGTYTVTLTVTDDRGGIGVARRTVTAAAPRQAALHPFASTSVWNTGIGSEAVFESRTDTRTANMLTATPAVNRAQWSIPVFRATTSDTLGTLYSVRDNKTYTIRIPAAATGAAGSGGTADGHATIIQPDGVTAYDTYKLVKVTETSWEAQSTRVTDLRGSGIGGGVRAAGVPALAGLIRAHELRAGRIDHAVAVAMPNSVLKSGWVFPARSQDANGTTAYYGQVPMGSLIALPPSLDISKLALSPEGRALARALQSYGGYVVDRAGTAALYCEVDCDAAATDRMAADWRILFREMRVVANSSATSVGGGGTPVVAPLGSVS